MDQQPGMTPARAIPKEEIHFHPTSFCDRHGRLFTWQGELYRALTTEGAALCRRMLKAGIVEKLVRVNLLIETEMTNLTVEGFETVVRHRRLPFVSLPSEWSPRMLRDAALLLADLEIALAREGLGLNENDITPANVLFDGTRPVYIDFGSIREAGARVYEDFLTSCLFPLQLAATQQARLGRLVLEPENGTLLDDLAGEARSPLSGPGLVDRLMAPFHRPKLEGKDMARLRAQVEKLSMPLIENHEAASPDPLVRKVVRELAPGSTLVVGGAGEQYLPELLETGTPVILADADERVVDRAYERHRGSGLLPLVLDLRYPPAGRGVGNREIAPATERLGCDLVLAPDFVERCVFQWFLNFDQVGTLLGHFARRWLAVAFRPPEDARLRQACADPYFAWYGLENFKRSLGAIFPNVEVRGSLELGQFLLLCSR